MSVQMSAARVLLRLTTKPRLARMTAERAKANNAPDPPPDVERAHACEVVDLGGVRSVWLPW